MISTQVAWPDMHRLAERTILEHLTKGGVLAGDVDEMLAADLGATLGPFRTRSRSRVPTCK